MAKNMRTVIGLTGDSSKGKGAVSEILRKWGFDVFILSDPIKDEAKKLGLPIEDRKVLQNLGDNLRLRFGNDILVKLIIKTPEFKKAERVVFDGIRHPDEIGLLRDVFDALIFGVDMSDERAVELMRQRNRPGDPKTMEEYIVSKERERGAEGSNEMQLDTCLRIADHIIWNEGDLPYLENKVLEALQKFRIEV